MASPSLDVPSEIYADHLGRQAQVGLGRLIGEPLDVARQRLAVVGYTSRKRGNLLDQNRGSPSNHEAAYTDDKKQDKKHVQPLPRRRRVAMKKTAGSKMTLSP